MVRILKPFHDTVDKVCIHMVSLAQIISLICGLDRVLVSILLSSTFLYFGICPWKLGCVCMHRTDDFHASSVWLGKSTQENSPCEFGITVLFSSHSIDTCIIICLFQGALVIPFQGVCNSDPRDIIYPQLGEFLEEWQVVCVACRGSILHIFLNPVLTNPGGKI